VYPRSHLTCFLHAMPHSTSSGMTQGSGFETNTSASNIIDRWTREACAIIVRHNNRNSTDLPMPELPARAYCAGMASSCYVLKAVDVEMLMLPGVLKADLRYLVCLVKERPCFTWSCCCAVSLLSHCGCGNAHAAWCSQGRPQVLGLSCQRASFYVTWSKLLCCEPAVPLTFPLAHAWHVITALCPVRASVMFLKV